jgi:hypothetical protein
MKILLIEPAKAPRTIGGEVASSGEAACHAGQDAAEGCPGYLDTFVPGFFPAERSLPRLFGCAKLEVERGITPYFTEARSEDARRGHCVSSQLGPYRLLLAESTSRLALWPELGVRLSQ